MVLVYDFALADHFESFSDATKAAQRWVDSADFFDTARIEIACQGDHWTIKVSEASFTPRYLGSILNGC